MGLWARMRARLSRNDEQREGVHDDDRLPTSAMVPGAAASGVWRRRRDDSFLGSADAEHHPPDDDFLKPRVR